MLLVFGTASTFVGRERASVWLILDFEVSWYYSIMMYSKDNFPYIDIKLLEH